MPGLTLDVKHNSELSRFILRQCFDRVRASEREFLRKHNKWREAEERAIAYLPEREVDTIRRGKRESGAPQYTTIQLPYSYAMLMASHTYWTSVFMARNPVLQFAGRHGETEQQIQALEALIDYQVQVGQMLVPWYVWLFDAGRYGYGVLGTHWRNEFSNVAQIIEVEGTTFLGLSTGKKKKQKISTRVQGYQGNKHYNVRPYHFLPDPRLPLYRFQEGEFVAVYCELGWNDILKRTEQGIYINDSLQYAKTTAQATSTRWAGSPQLELPYIETFGTEYTREKAKVITAYEVCVELVPDAWKLGESKSPEKWMFTVTSDFAVVLGAQPLGYLHDNFPFNIMMFEYEGYALINRGIPEILEPIQTTVDWLINSHFYNVRKAMNDQFVVDPSRLVMSDVTDPLPGGIMRLRPSAYGTDTRTAITQLNVVDVTQNHMNDLAAMLQFGEQVLGVNAQLLGQGVPGGSRKSATEVRATSQSSILRPKTTSEFYSALGWQPMAQAMVQNSQQLYDAERKYRIVGDLANEAGPQFINVDQSAIQGFYDFVPVDGTLPIDRFAQANLWREMFAQIRQMPEIAGQYDLGRIFGWVAQLAGLKNIHQFRVQAQPEDVLQQQAAAGNVVPISPQGGDLDAVPTSPVGQVGPTA